MVDDRRLYRETKQRELIVPVRSTAEHTLGWHLKIVELLRNDRVIILIECNQRENILLIGFYDREVHDRIAVQVSLERAPGLRTAFAAYRVSR